jgi:hypothetical protein
MTTEVAIRLLQGEPAEMAALQDVLESAPAYARIGHAQFSVLLYCGNTVGVRAWL